MYFKIDFNRFLTLFTFSISMALLTNVVKSEFDSVPPTNPFVGQTGLGTMHGDTASSDTTPLAGPGSGQINYNRINLLSACPTIVQANDGYILALCTTVFTREPIVYMISPTNGTLLASLKLIKGGLFGGVYAYVDNLNNFVVADGNKDIHRIGHFQDNDDGSWRLQIIRSLSILSVLPDPQDFIVGLSPDWLGNVWFASATAIVAYANLETENVQSITLPSGESIANSISTIPEGTFVTTDHALYMIAMSGEPTGIPIIKWRHAYERGPGRKPGQLSWGSGSTPTIFGTSNGTEYVTITDNAVPINLLVFETTTGNLLCKHPIFTASGSGSENSPIGWDNSVFISSTYGYPYLALPPNAAPSTPLFAKYTGGITRVDYNSTARTCSTIWTNSKFRNAAVAKLSIPDNLIYTMTRVNPFSDSAIGLLDSYHFATLDPNSGNVVSKRFAGFGMFFETQQIAPLITREGHYFQGVVTGINQIWKSFQ